MQDKIGLTPLLPYQREMARWGSPRVFSPEVVEAQARIKEQVASAIEAHIRARQEWEQIWIDEAEALCPTAWHTKVWLAVTWVCWRKWANMLYSRIHRDCGRWD